MQVKKYRLAEQCFLVQGAKAVTETLASEFRVITLCGTDAFLRTLKSTAKIKEVIETSEKELTSLGSVEANHGALAVVEMKSLGKPSISPHVFTLVLDDIRDPGNLGTIIRTADWYGVKRIIASEGTADVYNPKVINASMGSFLRVDVHYVALETVLMNLSMPVYGAFLDGKNVHEIDFGKEGVLVIGNESHGISQAVAQAVTHRITIPRFGEAESLNASLATAIILDNIRRSL